MSQIPPIKIPKLMNHPDLLIWTTTTTITLLQVTMTIIMISKLKWTLYTTNILTIMHGTNIVVKPICHHRELLKIFVIKYVHILVLPQDICQSHLVLLDIKLKCQAAWDQINTKPNELTHILKILIVLKNGPILFCSQICIPLDMINPHLL